MSSAAMFAPGAFGISLKPYQSPMKACPKKQATFLSPKKQTTFQSPMKACRSANCKQLYDPDIPANKKFYASLSHTQQDRRNHCPMHAAMALAEDDGGTHWKPQKSSVSSSTEMTELPTKRTLGFGAGLKNDRFVKPRPVVATSPRSSMSSSRNSILSDSTARKSSDGLLSLQPDLIEEPPEWEEKQAKTTFGFRNIRDDIEGDVDSTAR